MFKKLFKAILKSFAVDVSKSKSKPIKSNIDKRSF